MGEEETITDFYSRVQDLMNRASVLGKPFTQTRVVKKVLKSFPKSFRMKVTTIQENAGWENKTIGELMGNLHTYELQVPEHNPGASRKGKTVAFTTWSAEEQLIQH